MKKLYNIIFPIWMLIIFPPIVLIVIPGNFIIDSIVLLIGLHLLKLNKKENYKKAILKVWLFGFLADIIGSGLLLISQFLPPSLYFITKAVAFNPFENKWGAIYVVIVTIISGFLIYIFNSKVSFKKLEIEEKKKKELAIILALVTMPYLFLVPTSSFYNYFDKTQHIESRFDLFDDYLRTNNEIYIGDAPNITKSFNLAKDVINKELDITLIDNGYEIITKDYKFIINIKKPKTLEYEKYLKDIALLLMISSSNTITLEYRIEDTQVLTYTKTDLENEYNISLPDLKKSENRAKLEEIIFGNQGTLDTKTEGNEIMCIINNINTAYEKTDSIYGTLTVKMPKDEVAYINIENTTKLINFKIEDLKTGDRIKVKLPDKIKEIYPMNETAIEITLIKSDL